MKVDKQHVQRDGHTVISPLVLRLDPHSGVPPYLQIVHQIEQAVRLGYLRSGDQIPTVKEVVASLSVNPNTVLKAYRALESRGVVRGRPGRGTFVESASAVLDLEKLAALRKKLISGWLTEAAASGLNDEEITALFMSVFGDFGERSGQAHPRESK